MKVEVSSYGITDVGKRREKNEDHFIIAELSGSMMVHHTSLPIQDCSTIFGTSQAHLFLVADGLGGHAAGERASALAISAVCSFAVNRFQAIHCADDEKAISRELQTIAEECQKLLTKSAQSHPEERGMATTLTMAIVIWPRLYVVHVGDSRCYVIRGEETKQLTRDHTLGQLYTEYGQDFGAGEGANHTLWNVVGSRSDSEPIADVLQQTLSVEDQLLLCTDGLSYYLDETQLADVLSRNTECRAACEELVSTANQEGGHDNITVILVRFRWAEESPEKEAVVETRIPVEQAIGGAPKARSMSDTDEFLIADLTGG